MRHLIQVIGVVNLVAFATLALVAVRQWRSRREPAAAWAALAFGALGFVVVLGRLLPMHPQHLAAKVGQRVDIAVLVLFPYLLYRFTTAFREASSLLERLVSGLTVGLVVWTFVLPHFPATDEPRSSGFIAYLIVFLIHWTLLTIVVFTRLWNAGSGLPSVARRRMQLLALAAAAITIAIFFSAGNRHTYSVFALATALLAFVSASAFYLGLAPPAIVRMTWRRAEQQRVQQAIESLIAFTTEPADVAARVLPPMADIVGASAVELRDAAGKVVGTHTGSVETGAAQEIEVEIPGGSVLVRTSRYAPFFGQDEFRLLRTLGSLSTLALDRVRLFENERAARLALERADELKTNFVALAAHELRTPVTTIHGFVQTLNHYGDRLDAGQRKELSEALEGQTVRMAALVEQLLDLSRLDADAIEINPVRIEVRSRIDEVVLTAAGPEAGSIEVDVPAELEALIDPEAFERIVSNLVTNGFRYGEPPFLLRADQTDRHFRLSFEDAGAGVPSEFVPDLFERFSRSKEGRRRVVEGTGLGLAIARSYARAHRGDLIYEQVDPHGARFRLVLPAERR